MKKMTAMFSMALAAVLILWVPSVMANSGNMNLVNGFCGMNTVNCSSCHTDNLSYNCDPTTLSNCTTQQIDFMNDDKTGKYCSFCANNAQCTPAPSGCKSNADCDDKDVCNGTETCDLSTGLCQAGAPLTCDDGQFCNGTETCDKTAGCQPGINPCAGQSCDETTHTCMSIEGDGGQLYAANCAGCHGADGSGGTVNEDVKGESASEIREAIAEVREMSFLNFLSFDEIQKIAVFLSGGNHNDGDDDQNDLGQDNGDNHHDSDGDGMSDEDEGNGGSNAESMDSNHDGIPDYMDPKTADFPSDDDSGNMVLIISEGQLSSSSTVKESASLSVNGKPEGMDFPWGFIDFTVKGVSPYGTVNVTLMMPQDLPANAKYWKYDGSGYHALENAVIQGREVKFTLTDDDGDGIVVDPGAVGVPAGAASTGSGSGGGGCSVHPDSMLTNGIDPAFILLILIPVLIRLRALRSKA